MIKYYYLLSTHFGRGNLKSRFAIGSAWNLIATIFNQGSTFAVNIIVARFVGKQIFGEYAMVQSTLVTAVGLVQLAMGYTATKYVAEFRSVDRKRTSRILGFCSVVTVVMASLGTLMLVTAAPWLASVALKTPHLSTAIIIGGGYLFFSVINGFQIGVLTGLEGYRNLAKAGIVSGIVVVLGISLGAWLGGLDGSMMGLALTAFVRLLLFNWWMREELVKQGIYFSFKDIEKEKNILLKFALPAALSGCYTLPAIWLANSILVRQVGGYDQMALYSAATNIRILVLFVPNVINSVSLSILNNEKGLGDRNRYYRIFTTSVILIFFITFITASFFAIMGGDILRIFGKDFREGQTVLWLLLLSTLFEGLTIGTYQFIQSNEKIWTSFFGLVIPRETLLVIMAFIFVPRLGANGLGFAYLFGTVIGFLLVSTMVYRIHKVENAIRV